MFSMRCSRTNFTSVIKFFFFQFWCSFVIIEIARISFRNFRFDYIELVTWRVCCHLAWKSRISRIQNVMIREGVVFWNITRKRLFLHAVLVKSSLFYLYYAVWLSRDSNLRWNQCVHAILKGYVGLRRVSVERVLERTCLATSEYYVERYSSRCPTGRPTRRLQALVLSSTDGRGHASN